MEDERTWGSRLWEWTGFGEKKLWHWLELLSTLAIPVALGMAGFWLEAQLDERQRDIEDQRAQDAALQSYFDQMGELMLEKNLRGPEEDSEARTLARARTLTVLGRLDSDRKKRLLQFLYEADLIMKVNTVVDLDGADLRTIDLSNNNLSGGPFLIETQLGSGRSIVGRLGDSANLSGADMSNANLEGALLFATELSGVVLSRASLRYADLSNANLTGADLSDASLSGADLNGAKGLAELPIRP